MKFLFALFFLIISITNVMADEASLSATLNLLSNNILPVNSTSIYSELPLEEWKQSIKSDSRMLNELKKYTDDNKRLPDSYILELTSKLKSKLFLEQARWIKDAKCTSSAKGEFLSEGKIVKRNTYPNIEEDTINSFEDGFIRIEASGCLNSNSPMKVLSEYMKAEFQLMAIAELKSSEIKNNLICEKTEVFGIGPSQYCYNALINNESDGEMVSLHTYNLTNAPISEASASVYFRELIFTFKQVAPNKIAANVIVYVRGPNVPGLVRGFARSKIESAQIKLFKLLNQKIQ